MSWQRIKTVVLHTWYHFNHSRETWVDLVWHPFIQVLVFGFLALYFARGGGDQQGTFLVLGLILWQVVWVGQYSVTLGALWEIWSHSFSSLFMTPLTMTEFLVGQIIASLIKSLGVGILVAIMGAVIYKFSVLSLGWWLIIYVLELLVFAWASGLIILGFIFRYGTNIQSLAWSLVVIAQPLGAVFYPVEVLPVQIRWLGYVFPVTYVFEAARGQLGSIAPGGLLLMATGVNLIWFLGSLVFVRAMFNYSKNTGQFVRLEH